MDRMPSIRCCLVLLQTFLGRQPSPAQERRRTRPAMSRLPSVALGNTTTVSVTVLTGVSSTAQSSRPRVNRADMFWLATLLPLSLLTLRRTRRSWPAGFVCCLCCLIAATGCGAGRAIPLETWFESKPSVESNYACWNLYDRCLGEQRRPDADGQSHVDRSVGFDLVSAM